MPWGHGNAHAYASRSTAWRSPLKNEKRSETRRPGTFLSSQAGGPVLTAVVNSPATPVDPNAALILDESQEFSTPPSPKAKRRMDMTRKARQRSGGGGGAITIHDVITSPRPAGSGVTEFNAKMLQILDSWASQAERTYRKVTGHRLLLDGNGRSRITEAGERLENFYCMCKDMGGTRKAHGSSLRQEVHTTMALQDGVLIALLEWVIHFRTAGTHGSAEISQAVSKRVMDKSLPRGVMSTLVSFVAQKLLHSDVATLGVAKMHNTAITYWNQCGLSFRPTATSNVVRALAASNRAIPEADVREFVLNTPAVSALR